MVEMLHDEGLTRRVQAAERHAVRPRAMQPDDVENSQSSAEPGGDRNRDQSDSGDLQMKGRALQAFAQRCEATC